MDHTPTEIAAGGLTLAVAVGFLIYATQGAGFARGGAETYPLVASFRSAQGIGVGTDVRLAGVQVGRVEALELNRQTFRADMTISVEAGVDVPEDSAISISTEGLLGASYVEILPGGSPFNLAAGESFTETQGALSLIGLLAKFVSASSGE